MNILRFAAALSAVSFVWLAHAQDAMPAAPPSVATAANTAAAAAPAPSAPINPKLENSVVKIFSTLRRPDPFKPWGKGSPVPVTGSGVVIEGKRILTNAHVVGYASQVQVQASQSGDKVSATVVAVARGIDLAILKLDDESFFDTHAPATRVRGLPDMGEQVFAYGFPTGGTSLSVTKGIVSRVEFINYAAGVAGLRIQVDAALNPGNSGGPVFAGDKMVGLAFSGMVAAQNIGYIIANEEVELFLRDVADGRYDGKPALLEEVQSLENPVLREFLKLGPTVSGAVVVQSTQSDPNSPLKEWDVITAIGDTPVDNQAMVKVGPHLRVRFQYRVQQLAKDGKVALTIMRGGKPMTVQAPVSPRLKMLIPELDGAYPSYFIYGPIVFSRASTEFISFMIGNPQLLNAFAVGASPLVTQRGQVATPAREELVVVSAPYFPHKAMNGYGNGFASVVESVNKVPVRSLAHMVTLLRDLKDDLVVISFDQRNSQSIVLRRKEMLEATEAVLTDNGIRTQGTPDVMAIWNRK